MEPRRQASGGIWVIPVQSAFRQMRQQPVTRTRTTAISISEKEHPLHMEPRVLKGGPRHQVLIAVQAPATGRAAHGAAATALKGSSSSERAPPKPQGTPPSFPPGVVSSSSSSPTRRSTCSSSPSAATSTTASSAGSVTSLTWGRSAYLASSSHAGARTPGGGM